MIKRNYFVYAVCYSKESDQIFSTHWFTFSATSWLALFNSKLCEIAINHVKKHSDYAKAGSDKFEIRCISRL